MKILPNPSQNANSSGLICLLMMARYHEISINAEGLMHDLALDKGLLSVGEMVLGARALGLHAKLKRPYVNRLDRLALPAIARDRNGEYFLLGRIVMREGLQKVVIQRPLIAGTDEWTTEEFIAAWAGQLILIASRASIIGDLAKFDFSWFIPAVIGG